MKAEGTLKYPSHDDKKIPVTVYTLQCKEVYKAESQNDASRYLLGMYNLPRKSIQSMISQIILGKGRRKQPKFNNHLIYKLGCPCKVYVKPVKTDGYLVSCFDKESMNQMYFPSMEMAARYLRCSATSIKRARGWNYPFRKRYIIKVTYENKKHSAR